MKHARFDLSVCARVSVGSACVRARTRERDSVCICVCVCVCVWVGGCVFACVCMWCVCVGQREGDRDAERERGGKWVCKRRRDREEMIDSVDVVVRQVLLQCCCWIFVFLARSEVCLECLFSGEFVLNKRACGNGLLYSWVTTIRTDWALNIERARPLDMQVSSLLFLSYRRKCWTSECLAFL
jgi:hypothetical protein